MDSTQRRKTPGLFSCIATTAIAGLAGGALWCLLALNMPSSSGFLIVPLGGFIGTYFRWLGFHGVRGVVCAVAGVLIAFVYAQYLFAAVRIAQMLGFPLRNTLFRMDLGLAWQGALANLGARDFVWLALACAIAAWLALRISVRQ